MKEKLKIEPRTLLTDILFDIIGSIIYSAGIYTFAVKANFTPGGISGYASIMNYFTHIPIGGCILLLNIPIVIYCYKTLGKRFLLNSIRTMIINSLILDKVFPLLPAYSGDKVMSALVAGACAGVGQALIYSRNSSTGGSDFLILSLSKKFPHLPLGNILGVVDGSAIVVGGIIFGNVDAVLQGLIMTVITSMAINKISSGFVNGQMTLIVTEKSEEIAKKIMDDTGRGVTEIDGKGMFTGETRPILACVCKRSEATKVRTIVYAADAEALVVHCPFDNAYGRGFQKPD